MTAARLLLFASAALACAPLARADERAEAVAKQRAEAEAKLKAANLSVPAAETDDVLVYAAVSDPKLRPLANAVQKAYTIAAKVLKVTPEDKLWPGKLTAFVIPDGRQYKTFVLEGLKRTPEPRESYALALRGDEPYVLVGAPVGGKPTDAELAADAAALVAAAVLSKKAGPGSGSLPDWLQMGFGRATYLRADGPSSARLSAFRSKAKALYSKTRGQAFKTAAVWGGKATPDSETVATSFVDFLAYGPGAEKFPAFIAALKPTDDTPNPTPETALAAAEWKPEAVEGAWQKWVATGK